MRETIDRQEWPKKYEGQAISAGCLVWKVDKVLLIRTYKGWEIPKGHIDPEEEESVTAIRETREETGILSRIQYKLGTFQTPAGKLVSVYLSSYESGSRSPQREEGILEVKWIELEKAKEVIIGYQRHLFEDLTL